MRQSLEAEWVCCQNSVLAAAQAYRDQIVRQQLAAVSIDEFKNHLGGLRLRAVKDAGLGTLLDLQNWSFDRLVGLSGVGSETALGVVTIARQLTDGIRATPVPFPNPSLPDSNGAALFAQVAYLRHAQHLPGWRAWVSGIEAQILAQEDSITRNTTFSRWLASLSTTSRFKRAIAASRILDESLRAGGELHAKLTDCLNVLAAVQQFRSCNVVREWLVADTAANWAFYVSTIRGCILTEAPTAAVQTSNSGARPVPVASPVQPHASVSEAAPARTVPMQAAEVPTASPVDTSGAAANVPSYALSPALQLRSRTMPLPAAGAIVSESLATTEAPLAPVPIFVPPSKRAGNGEFPIPNRPDSEQAPSQPPNRAVAADVDAFRPGTASPRPGVQAAGPSRLVSAKPSHAQAVWLPIGTPTNICGFQISVGGLYVGSSIFAVAGGAPEPAQINPALSIAPSAANYRYSNAGYWPSYHALSPMDRASYLAWMSGGFDDPEVDPTYLFLHFYGLERRALLDANTMPEARAELPVIAERVVNLLRIHQARSASFRNYATAFLHWLATVDPTLSELATEMDEDCIGSGPTPALKLALAQVAVSQRGLPSHLALDWLRQDPNSWLRTPALRVPEVFGRLFRLEYDRAHPQGLGLPINKTKLAITYRPASASFGHEIRRADGSLPDVTVLTKPITTLRSVAEVCYEKLDSYSRFVGKNPSSAESLAALLLLPLELWPDAATAPLRQIRHQVEAATPLVLPLKSLFHGASGGVVDLSKVQYSGMAGILESIGLGIEPDCRLGGSVPGFEDSVALFALEGENVQSGLSEGYAGAALLAQLATAVAGADGTVSGEELAVLRHHLETALSLPHNEQRRLLAATSLNASGKRSLAGINKRIQVLGAREREAIGDFLVAIVKADGIVTTDEVKSLEKLWKVLELSKAALYSRLHVTEPRQNAEPSISTVTGTERRLRLDPSRVASLKKESSDVADLLGRVFADPAPEVTAIPSYEAQEEVPEQATVGPRSLLGLDQKHSDFLRTLHTRPEWTRAELEELCAERDLMVDGALERINDAVFERFDTPLFDGDDPININLELKLEGAT